MTIPTPSGSVPESAPDHQSLCPIYFSDTEPSQLLPPAPRTISECDRGSDGTIRHSYVAACKHAKILHEQYLKERGGKLNDLFGGFFLRIRRPTSSD